MPGFEMPSRAEYIRARVESEGLRPDPATDRAWHGGRGAHARPGLSRFPPTVWPLWVNPAATVRRCPSPGRRGSRGDIARPQTIDALLGFYSFDGGAPFVEGTLEGDQVVLRCRANRSRPRAGWRTLGLRALSSAGHHAGDRFMGGYRYINNAAVVAQWYRDQGAKRVSIAIP